MATELTEVHVWLRPVLATALAAGLAGCAEEEDPGTVGTTDGAVQVPAFDAGATPGGWAPAGTAGGAPGASTTGGSTAGGGTPGGSTPGGGTGGFPGGTVGGGATTGGFFGGGFPGGFPGGRSDGGRPDASAAVDAGSPVPSGDAGPDQFAELRQICVDTINMHRATLNLPPLARANATQESCSDQGAAKDGMTRAAHSSSGGNTTAACRAVGLGPQNTCPGHRAGPGTGTAAVAAALKRCLASMWAENEPPVGVEACKASYFAGDTACFLKHGHWINMTDSGSRAVSCGFYDMGNNTFWMNQDFVGN